MKKYIIKLLLLLAILLPLQLSAQLPNQIELRKFTTSGMVSFWITPENSKALGFDGSGNPAMLAVGGSSTLAGLSDVGLTSVADLNLLQYDAATSKWKNISGATYALASHTQDWSTITSTPTTLAGYNIVNPEIGAATATSINGAGIFSSLGVIGIGASSTAANRVAGMSGNIAIGASALGAAALTTFDENTAIGKNAMAVMTSTSTGGNTALGSQSMEVMTGGTQNTAIGYESMGQTTANISGVIAIGSSAGRNATANNELFINSQLKSSYANDQTQSIIYGGMASSAASQFLHFNVGYLQLGNSSTASELRLMEPSGSGTNYTGFKSPALAGDVVYTLPAADGTSGQALTTNGSGTLSFATVGVSDGDYGSVTVGGSGTTITIDAGAVTDSMLAGSISPSKVTGTAAILGANTFTGAQTITQATANAGIIASTGYSLTGSNATSMIDLAGTWNTSGTPKALKLNITNTASAALSSLLDLQFNGDGKFTVLSAAANSAARTYAQVTGNGVNDFIKLGFHSAGIPSVTFQTNAGGVKLNILGDTTGSGGPASVRMSSDSAVAWTNSTNGGTEDTWIRRGGAAATLQLGQDTATNSATAPAQTIKGPDATGTTSTGGSLTLAGGTGTSSGGSVILATSATTTPATAVTVNNNAVTSFAKPPVVPVYTVATLPATAAAGMVQGAHAVVTDATAPTYLGALTGGGAVVCPVFYNGTAWVSH